jgi:hypothetical protein
MPFTNRVFLVVGSLLPIGMGVEVLLRGTLLGRPVNADDPATLKLFGAAIIAIGSVGPLVALFYRRRR